MKQSDAIPPEVMQQFQQALGNLETALLAQDAQMKEHLRTSHRLLLSYPETAHLLEDHEIHLLIKRQEEYANIKIVEDAASKKGRGRAKAIDAKDL